VPSRGFHCAAESERAWNSISNLWRRTDTGIGVVGEEKDTDGPLENASSAPLTTWSFRAVIPTRLGCEDQKGNPNCFVSNQLVISQSQGLDTNLQIEPMYGMAMIRRAHAVRFRGC
jgi:hypothetical protein